MSLFVLWNVYNEIENLPRSVDACDAALGRTERQHIFIDGRYPEFEGETVTSQDGTFGYCQDAGRVFMYPAPEIEKRNKGLRYVDARAADGDWILVLDADEELKTFKHPGERFRILGTPLTGMIDFTRESDKAKHPRVRLYKWEQGLHFKGRHYTLYDEAGQMVASLDHAPNVETVGTGVHHDKAHSPERQKAKKTYYQFLREQETGQPH